MRNTETYCIFANYSHMKVRLLSTHGLITFCCYGSALIKMQEMVVFCVCVMWFLPRLLVYIIHTQVNSSALSRKQSLLRTPYLIIIICCCWLQIYIGFRMRACNIPYSGYFSGGNIIVVSWSRGEPRLYLPTKNRESKREPRAYRACGFNANCATTKFFPRNSQNYDFHENITPRKIPAMR